MLPLGRDEASLDVVCRDDRGSSQAGLAAAPRSVLLSQHCTRLAVARSNPLSAHGDANTVAPVCTVA
jgi:hypothetical protein